MRRKFYFIGSISVSQYRGAVYIYTSPIYYQSSTITKCVNVKSTTVYVPSSGFGTLPTPLSIASVPLPPEPGGGAHSPAGEGLGESQFRYWRKA
jgi:hypothetical protein